MLLILGSADELIACVEGLMRDAFENKMISLYLDLNLKSSWNVKKKNFDKIKIFVAELKQQNLEVPPISSKQFV